MATPPSWETSSGGTEADSQPMELATLGEHKTQCSATSGFWVTLRCGVGRLLGFVTARLVTTVAVLIALALAWLMFL